MAAMLKMKKIEIGALKRAHERDVPSSGASTSGHVVSK
jgi:hypothetical protein